VFLPTLVVRSRRVVTPRGTRAAAIHIRNERVIGVLDFDDVPPGCPLDDAVGAVIMPGLVDTHVHAHDSRGGSGFESATRAAAAGGVTTFVEMPFPGPATTTVAALEAKRQAAQGTCYADVGFWGGVVPGNARDLAPLFEAGVLGFKCVLLPCAGDDFPPVSEGDLRIAMPGLTRLGATLLAHAELVEPIDSARERQRVDRRWFDRIPRLSRASRRYATYLTGRPKEAENAAIARLIQLCRDYHTRTHAVHLSSSDALTPLFHARTERLPITTETCPHYLYFVADEIADGTTSFTCAPPIRERANREFLWAALANGLIQMVVSDHAAERRDGMCGLPSLQLSLPVTWTEARTRGYTLDQLAGWMCLAPCQLARLNRKGKIEVGYDADLVVLDPDAEFVVEPHALHPSVQQTPYLGLRLRGVVERTYLRGRTVYSRAGGVTSPHGTVLSRDAN
jgi:allantoinase